MKRITKHLNASTVIALLALVFAITGGAFAATGGGSPSHATLTASVAKSKAKAKTKAGPRGPAGKNGTNGTNGAPGATGPAGPTGPAGGTGPTGGPGTNGESVKVTAEGKCTKFSNASGEGKACEGKEGKPGTTGFTKELPSGATETGSWSFSTPRQYQCASVPGKTGRYAESECVQEASPAGTGEFEREPIRRYGSTPQIVSISFPIPLAAPLAGNECEASKEPCDVHYINKEDHEVGGLKETSPKYCKGTAAEPTAEPDNLCVYETFGGTVTEQVITPPSVITGRSIPPESSAGAGISGAELWFAPAEGAQSSSGWGTWAVTEK